MTIKHGLMVAALATVAIAVWILEPGQYLSLDYLKAQQLAQRAYVELHPLQSSVLCFGIYMIATALSIPGAVAMTLAAGAVFGLLWNADCVIRKHGRRDTRVSHGALCAPRFRN